MALANYTDLQASAVDWMERAGQSGKAPDWITLGEARLNREIGVVEMEALLTATVDSRSVDISALNIITPHDLFLTEQGGDEVTVQQQPYGKMPFENNAPAQPDMFAFKNFATIEFNRLCDYPYALRLPYMGRFTLSDANPTNDLLTNHPDVYLAATLMWGAGYNQDWQNGPVWKAILDEEIPKVRNLYKQRRRGMSRVDPAMISMGWRGGYRIESDT
jgi:hypothetical protein